MKRVVLLLKRETLSKKRAEEFLEEKRHKKREFCALPNYFIY